MPAAVAAGLRQRGVDVTTTSDASLTGASDEEQLAYALREGRVIVTHDRDFARQHTMGFPHAGIAYCHQSKYRLGELIRAILLLHECLSTEEIEGKLEFL